MLKSKGGRVFDVVNITLLVIFMLMIFYPLYFTVIASFSEPAGVAMGKVVWTPSGFTLDAYKEVFKTGQVWTGYRNSIFYTVAGTLPSLAITIPAAYVLSKKWLAARNVIATYFVFTMFFGGVMIGSIKG